VWSFILWFLSLLRLATFVSSSLSILIATTMRYFTSVAIVLLAVTSSLATPFSAIPHIPQKGDAVCKVDMRGSVKKMNCIPKGIQFTLIPPSDIKEVPLTVSRLSL
jgi:hypothetical protein